MEEFEDQDMAWNLSETADGCAVPETAWPALPRNASPSSLHYFAMLATWAALPIDFFGLLGSVLIVLVRCHPSLQSPVNLLLIGLGVSDAGVLLLGGIAFTPQGLYPYYTRVSPSFAALLKPLRAYCGRWAYPWALFFQAASIYILVLVTVERYLAICRPLVARRLCTLKTTAFGLCLVLLFCALYNLPLFFEHKLVYTNSTVVLRYNYDYWYRLLYELLAYLLVMFVVPLCTLSLLNWRILASLRRSVQFRNGACRNEKSTTLMLLLITLVFLLTNSFIFGVRIFVTVPWARFIWLRHLLGRETNCAEKLALFSDLQAAQSAYRPDLVAFLISLVNLSVAINSAVNFPVYYKFSILFRTGFKDLCMSGKEPFPLGCELSTSIRTRQNSPLLAKRTLQTEIPDPIAIL